MKWSDILLIDKPKGITSFDVIRILRKQYNSEHNDKAPKMGHAGTLDPAATGLMIIGVGNGTKLLKDYIGLDKEYVAEILLGEKRSTGDMDGEVIESCVVPALAVREVERQLNAMVGTLRLPVSAYSAMKKGGVPMYKRAREAQKIGELVKIVPWRDMEVRDATMINITPPTNTAINRSVYWGFGGEVSDEKKETEDSEIDKDALVSKVGEKQIVSIRFEVGSGTYIRSLAEELGNRLGYPATLYNLRRTRVGDFSLTDAQNLPIIDS